MKGFTLIEILIALAVFAIGTFGIYGLLNQCLYAQDFAEKRLKLILNTTKSICFALETPPEVTNDWVYLEKKGIDAHKVTKEKLGFFDIIKVEWSFKKAGIEISYEFYY